MFRSWLFPGLLHCILAGSPGSVCLRGASLIILNTNLAKSLLTQNPLSTRDSSPNSGLSHTEPLSASKVRFQGNGLFLVPCHLMPQVLCLRWLECPSSLSSQTNSSLSFKTQLCFLSPRKPSRTPSLGQRCCSEQRFHP